MLILCPNCATSYEIETGKLGAGRSVRCARCRTVWLAKPPPEAAPAMVIIGEGAEAIAGNAGSLVGNGLTADDIGRPPAAVAGSTPSTLPVPADSAEPDTRLPAITTDAPALVPAAEPIGDAMPVDPAEAPSQDIESAAARRIRIARETRHKRQQQRVSLPLVIAALAAIVAVLIGSRSQIVRMAPQSARLYAAIGLPVNLRGLVFADVKTSEETHEGVPVLVIQGEIVNVVNRTVEVPRLRFAVRSPAGLEIFAWTSLAGQPVLGPGEVLPFRSRLASPPPDAREILVRFFHRRDLGAPR